MRAQGNKATQFLSEAIFQLSRTINIAGLVVLVLMTLLIVAGVIGRYYFYRPITSSLEILEFMMAILVALGLAYTAVRKGHISIGLVISRFPSRVQAVVNSITSFFCLGVFATITWQAILHAESLKLEAVTSQMLSIPVYPFPYVLAFGGAILCLVFIRNLFEHLAKVIEGAHWLLCTGSLFLIILVLVLFSMPFWGQNWLPELSPVTIGVLGICLLVVLLFSGMPVAIAMALAGLLGIVYLGGADSGLGVLKDVPYNTIASYVFVIIPLFLLMSTLVQQSGIAQAVYLAATSWFGRFPGRMAFSSVVACTLNSTASASSPSNTTAVGAVALPQMKKYDHNPGLATGSIFAGSAITLLIPPSIGLIVYAILAEISITRTFLASLLPGIMISVLFLLYVLLVGVFKPNAAPRSYIPPKKQLVIGFCMLVPLGIWITPFMGMYMGMFTPTEAAAVAALIASITAIIWAPVWGRPIFSVLYKSVLQAVNTTCMIGLILIGAAIFEHFLTLAKLPSALTGAVVDLALSPLAIMIIISLVYIVLVYFIEPLTLMVFSLPVLFPLVTGLGFDPLWFGVILMVLTGIGLLLSPYHANLRLAQAFSPGTLRKEMMAGIAPFAVLMVIVLGLLAVFPQIALWLPGLIW